MLCNVKWIDFAYDLEWKKKSICRKCTFDFLESSKSKRKIQFSKLLDFVEKIEKNPPWRTCSSCVVPLVTLPRPDYINMTWQPPSHVSHLHFSLFPFLHQRGEAPASSALDKDVGALLYPSCSSSDHTQHAMDVDAASSRSVPPDSYDGPMAKTFVRGGGFKKKGKNTCATPLKITCDALHGASG
jgi:hypothetical protein